MNFNLLLVFFVIMIGGILITLFLIPSALIFAQVDYYELDGTGCLGGQGMVLDENCRRVFPSPYKQQQDGIDPQKVRCNHGLYRNYKTSDGTAFCASGYTISKLIHRDYAMNFDSVNSAVIAMPNSTVKEYCPSSQQLLQWGWYPYDTPPNVINTNIDLIYNSEENSKGVEFTFDPKTNAKSMIWIFVECN